VFRFGGAGSGSEYWIGSADLMHRNLDRRVEALVQVTDATDQADLDRLLQLMTGEDTGGFDLAPDGTWHRRTGIDPQQALLRRIVGRGE
jgi:polyphosphate kinase